MIYVAEFLDWLVWNTGYYMYDGMGFMRFVGYH